MIYDPITRQSVTVIGRYPPQTEAYSFSGKMSGDFRFVRVRYGECVPGATGGFPVGDERDCDSNYLVADDGLSEIRKAYESAPEIAELPTA